MVVHPGGALRTFEDLRDLLVAPPLLHTQREHLTLHACQPTNRRRQALRGFIRHQGIERIVLRGRIPVVDLDLARDPATGAVGGAVSTARLSVGNRVLQIEFGIGAVASQANTNTMLAKDSMDRLRQGATAKEALDAVAALVEAGFHEE